MEKSLFIKKISEYIRKHRLLDDNALVLVALSGGADSVALLLSLKESGYDCIAMHCNFHLRGEESDRDFRFVSDLCKRHGIRLVTTDFDVASYMSAHNVSVEMACRELRYKWFDEKFREYDASAIAVGHHRDDNTETFFLNLMRGSGVRGLASIKPRNKHIVRPLLCVTRHEIESYLESIGESFVTDSTNAQNDFLRNKLRNLVIPCIEREIPEIRNSIANSIDILQDENEFINAAIKEHLAKIVSESDDGWHIDIARLTEVAGWHTVLFRFLTGYDFNKWQCSEIAESITTASVGAKWHSRFFSATLGRTHLDVFPQTGESEQKEYVFILDENIPDLPIHLQTSLVQHSSDFKFERDANVAYFDYSLWKHTLTLRHWRNGDRFQPFGMKGSKKVSDLFTDLHLSAHEKAKAWLLTDGNEILWVIGLRTSNMYRCDLQSSAPLIKIKAN